MRSHIIAGVEDDGVFKALADPTRRLLLDQLFERDGRTLKELQSQLAMTRFGVMKHLRVLEAASLVTTRKVGREKLHYLNPVPIQLLYDRWIGKYDAARVSALADLKAALEEGDKMATAARPRQVYEVYINAPAERVWDAITQPEFTARYSFGARTESDWHAGSSWRSLSADGAVLIEGDVVEADPPRRLVLTFRMLYDPQLAADAPTRVTWELQPTRAGVTKVTVVHDGFEGETTTYRRVAGGWMWTLSNLKTLLETGEAMPGGPA